MEADEKSKRNEDNDKNMYNSDITHHTRSVRCSRSAVDCHPTVSAGVKARARKRRLGTALSLTALETTHITGAAPKEGPRNQRKSVRRRMKPYSLPFLPHLQILSLAVGKWPQLEWFLAQNGRKKLGKRERDKEEEEDGEQFNDEVLVPAVQ